MNYVNKLIKEKQKKEAFFADKMMSFKTNLSNILQDGAVVVSGNEAVIKEFFEICKEYENHVWLTKDNEPAYYTNCARAFYYYSSLLSQNLMVPGTNQYKKMFLKGKEDIEENVNDVVEILESALKYSEKSLSDEYKDLIAPYRKDCLNLQSCILNKLGTIYSLYCDVEKGIEFLKQAVLLGNMNAAFLLVYIYLSEEYFDLSECVACCLFLKKEHTTSQQTLFAYAYLIQYCLNNGLYKEISMLINDYKENIFPHLKNKESEEYALNLLNDYESKLKDNTQKCASEELLKNYFSEQTLSKMEENIKIFITTSLNLKKYIDDQAGKGNILDYSGATMPIMKALESILYEIFARHYLTYLKSIKNKLDVSKINRCFLNKSNNLIYSVTRLDVGDVLYLACDEINRDFKNDEITNYNINQYFLEFCEEKCKINNISEFVNRFIVQLDKIRIMRNKSAHKNRIFEVDAVEVQEYLVENYKFISFLYENFGVLFEQ